MCAEDYQVIYHICQYGETVNAAEVSQFAKDMLHSRFRPGRDGCTQTLHEKL